MEKFTEDYFNEAYEDFNGKFKKVLKVGELRNRGLL